MKRILISAFALNAIVATGGAAKEVLDIQQRQAVCNQFIIEDPGSGVLPFQFRDCCTVGHYARNCHLQIWEEIDR